MAFEYKNECASFDRPVAPELPEWSAQLWAGSGAVLTGLERPNWPNVDVHPAMWRDTNPRDCQNDS